MHDLIGSSMTYKSFCLFQCLGVLGPEGVEKIHTFYFFFEGFPKGQVWDGHWTGMGRVRDGTGSSTIRCISKKIYCNDFIIVGGAIQNHQY